MSAVSLSEYTSEWQTQFECVSAELASVLADSPGLAIEHVGSTSVPGLCAKPVIDLLIGVSSLKDIESRICMLQQLGFRYRPEHEKEIPDRRYFVREPGQRLRVHVHAVVTGSALWLGHLAFRDALRRDGHLAAEYASLKRTLALQHAHDKASYTRAKAPFIQSVLRRQREA